MNKLIKYTFCFLFFGTLIGNFIVLLILKPSVFSTISKKYTTCTDSLQDLTFFEVNQSSFIYTFNFGELIEIDRTKKFDNTEEFAYSFSVTTSTFKPVSGLTFIANVSSREGFFGVIVTDLDNGKYLLKFETFQQGEYNLRLYSNTIKCTQFRESNYNFTFLKEPLNFVRHNLLKQSKIIVKNTKYTQVSEKCKIFDSTWKGQWIKKNLKKPLNFFGSNISEIAVNIFFKIRNNIFLKKIVKVESNPFIFIPFYCKFKIFSANSVSKNLLKNKNIIFIGDSILRGLFFETKIFFSDFLISNFGSKIEFNLKPFETNYSSKFNYFKMKGTYSHCNMTKICFKNATQNSNFVIEKSLINIKNNDILIFNGGSLWDIKNNYFQNHELDFPKAIQNINQILEKKNRKNIIKIFLSGCSISQNVEGISNEKVIRQNEFDVKYVSQYKDWIVVDCFWLSLSTKINIERSDKIHFFSNVNSKTLNKTSTGIISRYLLQIFWNVISQNT